MAAQKEEDFNLANLLQAQRDLLAGPGRAAPAPAPGAPPGAAAGAGDDADAYVNLRHYAYLIYGRWWCVALAVVLVAGGALGFRLTTHQKCQAVVKVDLNESLLGSAADLFRGRVTYLDTDALVNLAKRKEVLEQARELLPDKLRERLASRGKEISPDASSAVRHLAASNPVMSDPVSQGDRYSVRITVQAEGDQQVAELLAEARAAALGQALVSYLLDSVGSAQRRKSLEGLLKRNDADLKTVSEELMREAVGGKAGGQEPAAGEELPPGISERLDFIQRQRRELAATTLRVAETEDRIAKITRLIEAPDQADQRVSPEIQARLAALHMELAQLEDRYKPGHPKYQRVKDEIETLAKLKDNKARDPNLTVNAGEAQLRAERYRASLDLESLKARQNALEENIKANHKLIYSKDFSEQTAKAMAHEERVRQRQALEELSGQLRRRLEEAEIMAALEKGQGGKPLASVDRVEPAKLVGASSWQVLGLAVVLGLVLGVLLALLIEHLDDTVRSELVARRASGLPVLSKLPLFAGAPGKQFISASEPRSDLAETFKVFHNHVRYAAPAGPERCLLVTSPQRGEGKSYVATNLALSFALEGNRVCLLDADLRRSKMHESLEVLRPRGPSEAGLCGYLEGALAYEDVVLATEDENLAVVLAGGRASNPPRALRSDRMRALLERLVREYDVVIIDAPPVIPVVDAAILAALVRSVLLVVRFASTRLGDLAEASGRLAHVNAPLAGVVINAVHGVMGNYAGYPGRRHYHPGSSYGSYASP